MPYWKVSLMMLGLLITLGALWVLWLMLFGLEI